MHEAPHAHGEHAELLSLPLASLRPPKSAQTPALRPETLPIGSLRSRAANNNLFPNRIRTRRHRSLSPLAAPLDAPPPPSHRSLSPLAAPLDALPSRSTLPHYLRKCVPVLARFRRSPRPSTLRSLDPLCDMPNRIKGQVSVCLNQTVQYLIWVPSNCDGPLPRIGRLTLHVHTHCSLAVLACIMCNNG